jgi:hypothetical protein
MLVVEAFLLNLIMMLNRHPAEIEAY